ncbi:unnamed protein product [Phaedon cochleariae]|uniref:Protein FAM177A1 n=1 Tax=Phaedon cochleariae TaxID=80249 RepID=A0A9P0GS37_PHACE|nr:unnamed protein product [Phaedon cochleariae]
MKMVLVRPENTQNSNAIEGQHAAVKVKTPKRVLHFCDGTLEEYSTDEEDYTPKQDSVVDPATLTWGPWLSYKAWSAGSSTLSVMDTVGEFMASLFGITTPRYYFELEEYKRREEMRLKQQDEEQGWSKPSSASVPLKDMSGKNRPVDV